MQIHSAIHISSIQVCNISIISNKQQGWGTEV